MEYSLSKQIVLVYGSSKSIFNGGIVGTKKERFYKAVIHGDIYWIIFNGIKNNTKWKYFDIKQIHEFLFDGTYAHPSDSVHIVGKTVLDLNWICKAIDMAYVYDWDYEWLGSDLHNVRMVTLLFETLLKNEIKWNVFKDGTAIPGIFLNQLLFPPRSYTAETGLLTTTEKYIKLKERFDGLIQSLKNSCIMGEFVVKLIVVSLQYAKWNLDCNHSVCDFTSGLNEDMLAGRLEHSTRFNDEVYAFVNTRIKSQL